MAHDGHKVAPRWPQDGPKMAQDGPRWPQVAFKATPRPPMQNHSFHKPSWPVLGHLGAILNHLGAILGPFWANLGPSWGHLGAAWGHLRATLGPLGAILGLSWGLSGPLGAIMGLSWGNPGTILAPFWGHLGFRMHSSKKTIISPFAPQFQARRNARSG